MNNRYCPYCRSNRQLIIGLGGFGGGWKPWIGWGWNPWFGFGGGWHHGWHHGWGGWHR